MRPRLAGLLGQPKKRRTGRWRERLAFHDMLKVVGRDRYGAINIGVRGGLIDDSAVGEEGIETGRSYHISYNNTLYSELLY